MGLLIYIEEQKPSVPVRQLVAESGNRYPKPLSTYCSGTVPVVPAIKQTQTQPQRTAVRYAVRIIIVGIAKSEKENAPMFAHQALVEMVTVNQPVLP